MKKKTRVGKLLGEASERMAQRRKPSFINSLNMKFVYIPPGVFMMGHLKGEEDGDIGAPDEIPHLVTLTQGFYMQTTEVSQSQWKQVMDKEVAHNGKCGGGLPRGVRDLGRGRISKRSRNSLTVSMKWRTPTNTGFPRKPSGEYACRAGTSSTYFFGENEGELGKYTWYRGNSGGATKPVAMKKPNPWGLYDMLGNVQEWCADWYVQFTVEPALDPKGPELGKDRVVRGGSGVSYARDCRCSKRFMRPPTSRNVTVGFRLVKNP